MGKKEEKLEEIGNPFKEFSLLKGEFAIDTPKEEDTDDVESGDNALLEEPDNLLDKDKAIEEGDKALEKVIEKQKKAAKKDEVVEDEEVIQSEDESEDINVTGFKEFTKELFNKGSLDFDDTDEDFEASPEGVNKLIDKTVQNRINRWTESLPEDYVKMLEFVENGGTTKQFLDTYYKEQSWSDFKIDTEDTQKEAITASLRLTGESEEDIQDMIEEWEINGTLEKRAKPAINKLQKQEAYEKDQLLKNQASKNEATKKEQLDYWNGFKKDLYDKDEINGFKLTPKTKDNLWNFMTAVDNRTGKTPYQEAIEKNKESSYLFAYLAMNNFDSKKLEKQVETKVANKFNSMVKNYSNSSKNRISSGASEEPTGDNPFSAFKGLK